MFIIRCIGVFILIAALNCYIAAQPDIDFKQFESEFNRSLSGIFEKSVFDRTISADNLFEKFCTYLQPEGSFDYAFDSIKKMGKIYSPDHQMRIYSWNIPIGVDQNLYYAIVQYYSKRDKKYYLQKLVGKYDEKKPVATDNWPGALYYEVVETKHAGQKYYTLLGFDLGNMLTNKKVIDVAAIDEFDVFYFCPSLIKYSEKMTDRIVFEFNEKISMTLKYNPSLNMIVFDHLSPEKPSLEGNYAYYGPDFSYDGLKFEKGIWVHYKNLNITD